MFTVTDIDGKWICRTFSHLSPKMSKTAVMLKTIGKYFEPLVVPVFLFTKGSQTSDQGLVLSLKSYRRHLWKILASQITASK